MSQAHESGSAHALLTTTRPSDSPLVEWVSHGWTFGDMTVIRPAENHWHMVLVKYKGGCHAIVTGPLTTSGTVTMLEGAEILWVQFKLGTFMPHLPFKQMLDQETILPESRRQAFYLKGSAWQFPDFENADTFLDHLAHDEIVVCDPVVNAVLQDQPHDLSPRTVRYRFLQATGLSQKHIQQMQRAQQAEALLRQGVPISDAVFELGYYDQPHLTKSLKHFIGYTPAQILHLSQLEEAGVR